MSPLPSFRRKYCVVLTFYLPENLVILSPIGLQYRGVQTLQGGKRRRGAAVAYKRYTLRNFFRTFLKHSSLSLTSSREEKSTLIIRGNVIANMGGGENCQLLTGKKVFFFLSSIFFSSPFSDMGKGEKSMITSAGGRGGIGANGN